MGVKSTTPQINILVEIEKAIKLFSFYPEGHVSLKDIINRVYNNIKQQLDSSHSVTYSIDRTTIYINDSPIEDFEKLSRLLFFKRIKTLIISHTFSFEELLFFIQVVSKGDLILEKEQSIKKLLLANNVSGISIEEMDYETIHEEIDREMEHKYESQEDELQLENVAQDLTDDEKEAMKLINLLEQEVNPKRYEELSDAIVIILGRLIDIDRYEVPLIAINTYTKHAYQRNKHINITGMAKKKIKIIAVERDMIGHILIPIYTGNPYYYENSIKAILIIGEQALEKLTDKMLTSDDVQSLKFISKAFTFFHKKSYPFLEKVITGANYRASQIAIDTVIAIRTDAEQIIVRGMDNRDIRVQRKAIQSLFELNTDAADLIISKLINPKTDHRTLNLLIPFIGKHQKYRFIALLKDILNESSISYTLKTDILLVLGELGNRDAVDAIIKSVFDVRSELAQQYPEIKLVGIKALGTTMNEVAIATLVKLLENKNNSVRDITWNMFYEIGKRINA